MINNPLLFKGLNIRIPIIIPIKGRGFTHKGVYIAYYFTYLRGPGKHCVNEEFRAS